MNSRMPGGSPSDAGTVVVRVELAIAGERVQKELEVPRGPTRPVRMLPVFQAFADEVIGRAAKEAEAEGRTISCRAGCTACCHQLIPVSETEARRLAELLEALPVPAREAARARFAAAREKLEARGLWERLVAFRSLDEAAMEQLGLDYLRAGVPCPFLEGGTCSIYADRPLSCREFLVTSPAENCRDPTPETIAPVALPGHASDALARLDVIDLPDASGAPRAVFWLPLVFAPAFTEEHADTGPEQTGIEWLNGFLGLLAALSDTGEGSGESAASAALRRGPKGPRGNKGKRQGKKKPRR